MRELGATSTAAASCLDLSIAAACGSRGIAACNGIDDSEPVRSVRSTCDRPELAIALAAVEELSSSALAECVTFAFDALLADG